MAFHPMYWGQAVRNSSREYNYYKWNKESRREASKQIKVDTRKQPQAEEALELDSQLRLVCEAGGLVIFSVRPDAFDSSKYVGSHAVQHRFQDSPPGRRSESPGVARTSIRHAPEPP